MKLQNKLIIRLGIVMLVGITMPMKRLRAMEAPEDELVQYYEQLVAEGVIPQDIQGPIRRLQLIHNSVRFLGGLKLIATTRPPKQGYFPLTVDSVAIRGNNVVTTLTYEPAKLWDISNGQFRLIATTPTQDGRSFRSVAMRDNMVVTGSDENAKLWDISNGQFRLVATTPTSTQPLCCQQASFYTRVCSTVAGAPAIRHHTGEALLH